MNRDDRELKIYNDGEVVVLRQINTNRSLECEIHIVQYITYNNRYFWAPPEITISNYLDLLPPE